MRPILPASQSKPLANRASRSRTSRRNGSVHKRQTGPCRGAIRCAARPTGRRDQGACERRTIWRYGRFVGCPRKTRSRPAMPALVELAYQAALDAANLGGQPAGPSPAPGLPASGAAPINGSARQPRPRTVSPIRKELRRRNKAHLAFVGAQPCLVCQRSPCDAHHLKFAQPRALGRKVSDEFAVPLCREHHDELHRHGNEMAWWANLQIAPLETARELWEATTLHIDPTRDTATKSDPDAECVSSSKSVERANP